MLHVSQIENMNNIGEVLKSRGLKQKWLAEQLGLTPVMINLYVRNKRQPKLETMIRISQLLQVGINDLVKTY